MRMGFPGDPGCLDPAYLQKLPLASAGGRLAKRPPETGTKKMVASAQNSESGNSASPGLLLLDSFRKPIYVNVSQMHTTPNSAKTFLRSVMFKIGARERSGILVKSLSLRKGLAP